jgi:hypothetical protein
MIPMKGEPGGPARSNASSRPEIFHRHETEDEPALAGIQLSQRQLELQSRRQQQRQRSHSSSVNHQYPSQQPLTALSLKQQRDDVASSFDPHPATSGGRKNQKDHPVAAVPVMDNNNGSRRSFLGRKTSPKAETENSSSNHNILRAAVAATTSRISPRTVGSGSTVSGHHRFSARGGGGVAAASRPRPHSSPRGEPGGDVLSEDSDTARQYAIIRSFKSKSTASRGSINHDTNNHNSGSTTLKDHHKNNNNNNNGARLIPRTDIIVRCTEPTHRPPPPLAATMPQCPR